jgi:hypothetical protein
VAGGADPGGLSGGGLVDGLPIGTSKCSAAPSAVSAAGTAKKRGPHLGRVEAGGAMTSVLAFDVNETLLDLTALDPMFETVLGDAALRPTWFGSMLQLSFVGGLTGRYVDFTTAQEAALRIRQRGWGASSAIMRLTTSWGR